MLFELKMNDIAILKDGTLFINYGNSDLEERIDSNNNSLIFSIIKFMANKMVFSLEEIRQYFDHEKRNDIDEIFEFLQSKGLIYRTVAFPSKIIERETRIKNYVNKFPSINYKQFKNKIKSTNIILFGVGTAGSYLLEGLIKLGFTSFVLIDNDYIEPKNISAQNFSFKDIGKHKASVLKEKYENEYSNISVRIVEIFISDYSEIKKIVQKTTLKQTYFINCADSFHINYLLITHVLDDFPKLKYFDVGYGGLSQYVLHLTLENKTILQEYYSRNHKLSVNLKCLINKNSGTILNAFYSCFFLSSMLFNDIIDNNSENDFSFFNALSGKIFMGKFTTYIMQKSNGKTMNKERI